MLDVILQWARFDGLVSQWVLFAYGLSPDGGALLLGTMDTRNKLDKIKALYEHHGMTEAVGRIAYLQKCHGKLVDVRNAIAHAACGGQKKSDPKMVIFAPVKAMKGMVGKMMVETHSIGKMKLAAQFATEVSNQLYEFTQPFLPRLSEPPAEPPELLGKTPASPEKKRDNKRRSRPQENGDQ